MTEQQDQGNLPAQGTLANSKAFGLAVRDKIDSIYKEVYGARQTGKTFRVCTSALCSASAGCNVFLVVRSGVMARYTTRLLTEMTRHLYGMEYTQTTVAFPGDGARIVCVSRDRLEDSYKGILGPKEILYDDA